MGPRARPGGDLALLRRGVWFGNPCGAPLPLGPRPCFPVALRRRLAALAARRSVSWPPPFGYQTRWRALVCGRLPGPLRPPLRVRRHRPARRRCCVQTGGIVRPLPPPCPPPPPALARARLGVGRVPARPSLAAPRPRARPPVEGCPGLGPAPAPRERVRRPAVPASARPVRGSVPRLARRHRVVGGRRALEGGTCACPPPPLHAVAGVGPVPRGRGRSVRHARSLRGGTGPVLSGRGARACSAFPSPRAPAPRGEGGRRRRRHRRQPAATARAA